MWLPIINHNWKVQWVILSYKLPMHCSSYYIFLLYLLFMLIIKSS